MTLSGGSKPLPRPLREVEAYWEALRTNGDIPSKADVAPTGLECALPYMMILERLAPGVSRFRFGGQVFHDLLGMSAERVPLTVLFASSCQRDIACAVDNVFQKPAILRGDLASKAGIGRPSISAQMVLMPLKDAAGGTSQALGALYFEGRLGRVPRQFSDMRLKQTRLILDRPYSQPDPKPLAAYEPDQPGFSPKKTGRPAYTGRPRLRVIHGDKA